MHGALDVKLIMCWSEGAK